MTPDIHDLIRELTQPTTHQEPYWITLVGRTQYHTTTHPPLITQLYDAVEPSGSVGAGVTRPASSQPGARIDAIDTANRIDREATTWLHHFGYTIDGDTIDRVRRLAPVAIQHRCHLAKPERGCCVHHDIENWWIRARVITGWDLPAWKPHNTCPACGNRGTLRVRLIDKIATCADDECRAAWNPATFQQLADHIRAENHEDQAS